MVPKPICGIFTPSYNVISGMSDNCARQMGGVAGQGVPKTVILFMTPSVIRWQSFC